MESMISERHHRAEYYPSSITAEHRQSSQRYQHGTYQSSFDARQHRDLYNRSSTYQQHQYGHHRGEASTFNHAPPIKPGLQNGNDYQRTAGREMTMNGAYQEHPEVAMLTNADIQKIYREMEVTVQTSGGEYPKPITRFELAPFPEGIVRELYHSGYDAPYPIQSVGWAVALASRDMIGIAKTGSGKTLAYLLPGIVHIRQQPPLMPGDGPLALILAPTRELAMQIEKVALRFMEGLGLTCVYGGVPRGGQARLLHSGVHLCIATPGRLLDFMESKTTNLRRVTFLVLDEADRMLDMGFEPQMRRIVAHIRAERQTLMWSATWPKEVQKLARDLCRYDPVRVTVGSHELQANENIKQIVEVCHERDRFLRLVNHLTTDRSNNMDNKTLVFCETKRGCDILRDRLRARGLLRVAAIHGDKEQRERDRILTEFKNGRSNILIATDVASRGLDIKNIDLVINYDVPKTIEDYVHRIGRTGRAGAPGTAITLFSDAINDTEKFRMAKQIALVISDVGQTPPVELAALANVAAPMASSVQNRYRSAMPNRYGRPFAGGYQDNRSEGRKHYNGDGRTYGQNGYQHNNVQRYEGSARQWDKDEF